MTVENLQHELSLVRQKIAFFERERLRYQEPLEQAISKIPAGSNASIPKISHNYNTWMPKPTPEEKKWLREMNIRW